PLLQLVIDEHLIGVRVVDRRLTSRYPFSWHDHRLDAHQELVVAVDARRRRNDDSSGASIDGHDGPGRPGHRRQDAEKHGKRQDSTTHLDTLPGISPCRVEQGCENLVVPQTPAPRVTSSSAYPRRR